MLDEKQADEIIEAARKHGIADVSSNASAKEKIQVASELVQLAEAARKTGNDGQAVIDVLSIAGKIDGDQQEAPGEQVREQPKEPSSEPVAGPEGVSGGSGGDLPETAQEQDVKEEKQDTTREEKRQSVADAIRSMPYVNEKIRKLGIKEPELPDDLKGNVEPLPRDITKMDDSTVRRLHWERHILDTYTGYHLSIEQADRDYAQRIASHRLNKVMSELAENKTKDASVTELKAKAMEDEEYIEWEKKVHDHEDAIRIMKQLQEGYEKDCTRLSRELSARKDQRAASGEVAPR